MPMICLYSGDFFFVMFLKGLLHHKASWQTADKLVIITTGGIVICIIYQRLVFSLCNQD